MSRAYTSYAVGLDAFGPDAVVVWRRRQYEGRPPRKKDWREPEWEVCSASDVPRRARERGVVKLLEQVRRLAEGKTP